MRVRLVSGHLIVPVMRLTSRIQPYATRNWSHLLSHPPYAARNRPYKTTCGRRAATRRRLRGHQADPRHLGPDYRVSR